MVASKLDIINAFVRVGPQAEKLLQGSIKVINLNENVIII